MKTYVIFLVILLSASCSLSAQHSVNSSGGNIRGNGGSASLSVGQIAYTALRNDSTTITQGVQQTWDLGTQTVQRLRPSDVQTRAYPNPVSDALMLELISGNPASCKWNLSDFQGKILLEGGFEQGRTSISAKSLSGGTYLLNLSEKGQIIQSQKIIKH